MASSCCSLEMLIALKDESIVIGDHTGSAVSLAILVDRDDASHDGCVDRPDDQTPDYPHGLASGDEAFAAAVAAWGWIGGQLLPLLLPVVPVLALLWAMQSYRRGGSVVRVEFELGKLDAKPVHCGGILMAPRDTLALVIE